MSSKNEKIKNGGVSKKKKKMGGGETSKIQFNIALKALLLEVS